jgi:hypothetical protein
LLGLVSLAREALALFRADRRIRPLPPEGPNQPERALATEEPVISAISGSIALFRLDPTAGSIIIFGYSITGWGIRYGGDLYR